MKIFFTASPDSEQGNNAPRFVGTESCVDCHLPEFNAWVDSDYDRAMDAATEESVQGDFAHNEFKDGGVTYLAFTQGAKYMFSVTGADNRAEEFQVNYVVGHTPLQQYMVESKDGSLQILPLAWNTLKSEWFLMDDASYGNRVHRKDATCVECHATEGGATENQPGHSWFEAGVGCEACHGPGSKHLEWAELPDYARGGYDNFGLQVKTSGLDSRQYVDLCARCHARRDRIDEFDYTRTHIYDYMIPDLPDEPDWYIDGQMLNEGGVYTSFVQSEMYMKGVTCKDCHIVHSGKPLLYNLNELCLQCHIKETYDSPSHHFHKEPGEPGDAVISETGDRYDVGSGTLCINCHMPGKYYMGGDYRHDHSFRVPRPDLSERYGVPNACNGCHAGKSSAWANTFVTRWHGESKPFHFADAFGAALENNETALKLLQGIAENGLYPNSIRSLAVHYLGRFYQEELQIFSLKFRKSPYADIRLAIVRSLEIDDVDDIDLMAPFLRDETKAVRTEAAMVLSAFPTDYIPAKYQVALIKVLNELKE